MANNSDNVAFGAPNADGALSLAPYGTALPTDGTTALPSVWKCLGYVSDGGMTQSTKRTSSSVSAWGGDTVAERQTKFERNKSFELIECLNPNVLKMIYGDENVIVANNGNVSIQAKSNQLPYVAMVYELMPDEDHVIRKCVGRTKVTEVADVSYVDGDPIKFGITMKEFPDANGVYEYTYIAAIDAAGSGEGDEGGEN